MSARLTDDVLLTTLTSTQKDTGEYYSKTTYLSKPTYVTTDFEHRVNYMHFHTKPRITLS